MHLLSRILTILAYLLPFVLVAAIYLAIDLHPTVRRASEITPGNIHSARQILAQNDPLKPPYRTRQSLTLSQQDLDLAANYLAYFYANGGARIFVRNGKIDLTASLRPPKLPVIFYFNIGAILSSGGSSLQFEELRVGQLPLPGFVGDGLIKLIGARLIGTEAYDLVNDAIKRVEIRNGQIVVGYQWPRCVNRQTLRGGNFSGGSRAASGLSRTFGVTQQFARKTKCPSHRTLRRPV